tara:strand:+ start:777 stop:1199 length:423 start_codon:yes stop_codon:yes gene_type:complete
MEEELLKELKIIIMSTRAQVRFATREDGVSFSEYPDKIHAQFYVHSDGYPEGLGVNISKSLLDSTKLTNWEVESLDTRHGDLEYIYYIWQAPLKTTWISIFEVGFNANLDPLYDDRDKCIFVGEPQKLIEKYNVNTNYIG